MITPETTEKYRTVSKLNLRDSYLSSEKAVATREEDIAAPNRVANNQQQTKTYTLEEEKEINVKQMT